MNQKTIIFFSFATLFFIQTSLPEESPQKETPQSPNSEKKNDTVNQVLAAIGAFETVVRGSNWVYNNVLRPYTPEEAARRTARAARDCFKRNINGEMDPHGFPSACEDTLFAFGFARDALDPVPPDIPTMQAMIDEFREYQKFLNLN